jgi:hypothetical protein
MPASMGFGLRTTASRSIRISALVLLTLGVGSAMIDSHDVNAQSPARAQPAHQGPHRRRRRQRSRRHQRKLLTKNRNRAT